MRKPERADWAHQYMDIVAVQVRNHRKARGMSAQTLADALAAHGVPINRATLAAIERGKRPTLSVVEAVALASVLHVPLVALLLPPDGKVDLGAEELLSREEAFAALTGLSQDVAESAVPGGTPTPLPIPRGGRRRSVKPSVADEVGLSAEELKELPAIVSLETANHAIGIGRGAGYKLARAGEYPVRILRIGGLLRVARADLLRFVGIEP